MRESPKRSMLTHSSRGQQRALCCPNPYMSRGQNCQGGHVTLRACSSRRYIPACECLGEEVSSICRMPSRQNSADVGIDEHSLMLDGNPRAYYLLSDHVQ